MRVLPFIGLAWILAGHLPPILRGENTVKITPLQITETRSRALTTKDRGGAHEGSVFEIAGAFNGIILRLRAEGGEIQSSMRAENIRIIEALDDTGQKLRNAAEATGIADGSAWGGDFLMPDWASAAAAETSAGQAKEARRRIDVQIRLTPPSRKATKLARVKGEFEVRAGGSGRSVTFRNLASSLGRTLSDPVLRDGKLEVTLLDPSQEKGGDDSRAKNTLTLKIKGNLRRQSGKVELLDSQGRDVTRGKTSTSTAGTTTLTYDLNRPLDNRMVLKISFLVGQKPLTVPFDLRDIELP